MFCGAWVYFNFAINEKKRASKRNKTQKETIPHKGWEDCRPNGLSHSFFSVTIVLEECLLVLYNFKTKQTYKLMEEWVWVSEDEFRGGAGCSESTKFRQSFSLAAHKTYKNNKLMGPKDAKNHFERTWKIC